MGNRIIHTVGLCSLIAITLLSLSVSCGKARSAPESAGGTPGSVFINPKSQTVKPASQFKATVEIVPSGWGVSAAEIHISFDPAKLEASSVEPGGVLGQKPISGTLKIDNARGTIVYALARVGETPLPGTKGVLANLEFTGRSGAKGTTRIEITKVGLTDENFGDILGLKYEGANVIFR